MLGFDANSLKSPALAFMSAMFYGLYTVIARRSSLKIGSLKMNAYSFLIGSLTLLPILLILKVPVGYFHIRGSLVFFGKPVLASVIAMLFLKEHGSWNLLAGMALIIFGIFISLRKSQGEKSNPA